MSYRQSLDLVLLICFGFVTVGSAMASDGLPTEVVTKPGPIWARHTIDARWSRMFEV